MEKTFVNLIKLCVGAQSISDLAEWQSQKIEALRLKSSPEKVSHITRMRPKREIELLSGGSIYWVFKGLILARQEILALEEFVGNDTIKRCRIILDKEIYKTIPRPKRAFQGWRYLEKEDSPDDVGKYLMNEDELPHELQLELSRLGVC